MDSDMKNAHEGASKTPSKAYVLGGLLLVILIVTGGYLYTSHFGDSQGRKEESTFEYISAHDPNFARAVDLIQSGTNLDEARQLLAQSVSKAEQEGNTDTLGLLNLWIAMSYNLPTADVSTLKTYADKLTAVALNGDFVPYTRSFAYAFTGELFTRLFAGGGSDDTEVLNHVFVNTGFKKYVVASADGIDFRASAIAALEDGAKLTQNSLLYARLASILVRGVELGWPTGATAEEKKALIEKAMAYVGSAEDNSLSMQSGEAAGLYPEYLFLVAQTNANAKTIDSGNYSSLVTANVDALYTKAIQATVAVRKKGTEASARYTYAKYLVNFYNLKATHTTQEQAALTEKLDEILQGFTSEPELRNTAMFGILLHAKNNNPAQFASLEMITKFAPNFKKLMQTNNAL